RPKPFVRLEPRAPRLRPCCCCPYMDGLVCFGWEPAGARRSHLRGGTMLATKPAREIPPYTYEPWDEMPPDYREAVVKIQTIQARIETEYPMFPERTLVPAMRLAPTPDDWVRYASYWAQECQHASYWIKMLADLGITVDEKFMSTPKPIYIFDMRDPSDT